MAIERVRRVGPYAPLSATYYQDDAIADVGEAAELLFLRGLAFCASRLDQDGFISRTQLVRFVGVGMADALDRAERLVEVDLWERVEGGFVVRSWLRWNKSAEEIGRYQARDRERKRKAAEGSSEAESESESHSERNPSGGPSGGRADSETASDTQSTSKHFTSLQPPSSESMEDDMEDSNSNPSSNSTPKPKPGSDDDPHWVRFWSIYPRREGKKVARQKWATAVKVTDPEVIIAAAERYRDQVAREGRIKEKIKMPEGWLNGERWADELATTTPSNSGAWWDN